MGSEYECRAEESVRDNLYQWALLESKSRTTADDLLRRHLSNVGLETPVWNDWRRLIRAVGCAASVHDQVM